MNNAVALDHLLMLLALFLSSSALVPATASGQTKDVKAEAALAKLNAASDASIAKMEKCNSAKVYDRKCSPLKESLASWAANLDCSVAIVDKHNREFPSEPWASIAGLRDSLFGKPDAERLKKANACVEHGGIVQP